jgi:hypothetical protein
MTDSLRWLSVTAFPGVDSATNDHLIQPNIRYPGPALMRRMVGADPFRQRGVMQPGLGYSTVFTGLAGTTQALISAVIGSTQKLYRISAGVPYLRESGTWTAATSSFLPLDDEAEIDWCVGNDALFLVDGVNPPMVIGWNYVADDPNLTWDTQHTIAKIKYTDERTIKYGGTTDFPATGCCYHAGRLVLWRGSRVVLSGPNAPCKFHDPAHDDQTKTQEERNTAADWNEASSSAWFLAAEEDGLDITNAMSFENQMLVVGKPHSLWGYVGTDPASNYSRVCLDSERGVYAKASLCSGANRMWFCAHSGPCVLDVKKGVNSISEPIQDIWDALSDSDRALVIGWFEGPFYHIVLPVAYTDIPGTIPSVAKVHLIYDSKTGKWAQTFGVNGMKCEVRDAATQVNIYTVVGDTVFQQSNGVLLADPGATPAIQPIHQELVTPWFDCGSEQHRKWLRTLVFELTAAVADLSIDIGTDYGPGWIPLAQFIPTSPQSVKWGHFTWRASTDTNCVKFLSEGVYSINIPQSVHCRVFRCRIRGKGLTIRSMAFGFDYEGV